MSDAIIGPTIIDGLITAIILFAALLLAVLVSFFITYFAIVMVRMKKREELSLHMVTLEVRLPKDNEIKIDAAEQLISSLSTLKKGGWLSFMEVSDVVAF